MYTINEVSALMNLSRRTVIRLFEKEPGITIITRPETMHKKRYRTFRIPRHVYDRVLNRVSS